MLVSQGARSQTVIDVDNIGNDKESMSSPRQRLAATRSRAAAAWPAAVHWGAWVLRLMALGIGLLGLIKALATTTGRSIEYFVLPIGEPLPLMALPQVEQAVPFDTYVFSITELPAWFRVLAASPGVVSTIAQVAAALMAATLVREIAAGRAFQPKARRRLAFIAGILIIGGVLQALLDTAAVGVLDYHTMTLDRSDPWGGIYDSYTILAMHTPGWPVAQIVTGVVTAVIAIAFRDASRLEEETGLVV